MIAAGEDDPAAERWRYDRAMRPLSWQRGSESRHWRYPEAGGRVETHARDGMTLETRTVLSDGSERLERPGTPVLEIRPGADGSLAFLSGGTRLAEIQRHPNGALRSVLMPGRQLTARYDETGLQTGLVLSAPLTEGGTTAWLEEASDHLGRPVALRDASGWSIAIAYDATGRIAAIGRPGPDGRPMGHVHEHDAQGRLRSVRFEEGGLEIAYHDNGLPAHLGETRGEAARALTLDALGRPLRRENFSGATTSWHYPAEADGAEPLRISLPDGLEIAHRRPADGTREVIDLVLADRTVRVEIEEGPGRRRYAWSERIP